jgi:hypothetical protein
MTVVPPSGTTFAPSKMNDLISATLPGRNSLPDKGVNPIANMVKAVLTAKTKASFIPF